MQAGRTRHVPTTLNAAGGDDHSDGGILVATNGVFCLEGEWHSDLENRASVLPLLDMLERLGEVKAIHRDVGTKDEAARYLGKYAQRGYDDYRVLYLAAHGDRGRLRWSNRNFMALDELGRILGTIPEDRSFYVYLGSCLTMFRTPQVKRLVIESGAKAVIGYRNDVYWLESAAFELMLLPLLANHSAKAKPETLFKDLMDRHGQFARHLKLVVGTSSGVLRAQDFPASG